MVNVEDAYGNLVTTSTASVGITSTAAGVTGTTTVNAVAGVATFSGLTFNAVGSYTLTAASAGVASATTTGSITVSPAALAKLVFAGTNTTTAGAAFSLTLIAEDAFNNRVTTFSDTVVFTKTDSGAGALVPASYTFTGGDSGQHTFPNAFTLVTSGSQTVTATDLVNGSVTAAVINIAVSAAAATHLSVTAPGTATAGTAFNAVVTAPGSVRQHRDRLLGNSPILEHRRRSCSAWRLHAHKRRHNYFCDAEDGWITHTVAATDTVNNAITGTTNNIAVSAGAASKLAFVGAPPSSITAGQPFGVTVQVDDAYGNVATLLKRLDHHFVDAMLPRAYREPSRFPPRTVPPTSPA